MIYNKDEVEKMIYEAGSLFGLRLNEGPNKEFIKEALNVNKDEINKIILGSGDLFKSFLKESLNKDTNNKDTNTEDTNTEDTNNKGSFNEDNDVDKDNTGDVTFNKEFLSLGQIIGSILGSNTFEDDSCTLELFENNPFSNNKEVPFKVNIEEYNDRYHLKAELPGYHKALINVKFNKNVLTITANISEVFQDESCNFLLKEINKNDVKRSFEFPFVDESNILADFENGILDITLFKAEEKDTVKVINIK